MMELQAATELGNVTELGSALDISNAAELGPFGGAVSSLFLYVSDGSGGYEQFLTAGDEPYTVLEA